MGLLLLLAASGLSCEHEIVEPAEKQLAPEVPLPGPDPGDGEYPDRTERPAKPLRLGR